MTSVSQAIPLRAVPFSNTSGLSRASSAPVDIQVPSRVASMDLDSVEIESPRVARLEKSLKFARAKLRLEEGRPPVSTLTTDQLTVLKSHVAAKQCETPRPTRTVGFSAPDFNMLDIRHPSASLIGDRISARSNLMQRRSLSNDGGANVRVTPFNKKASDFSRVDETSG